MQNTSEVSLDKIYALLQEKRLPSLPEALQSISDEIGQRQLCDALGLQRGSLQRILSGEAQKLDVMTVLKVSQFLNVDVRDLLQNLVAEANDSDQQELEIAKLAGFLTRNFDLPLLKKLGLIDDIKNFRSAANSIAAFFDYSNIYEYGAVESLPFFSRTRAQASDKMHNFWLRIVHYQVQRLQNPNPYSRDALIREVPKLRAATRNEAHGFRRFCKLLYRCGVTVFVESYVSKTQIRGGTLIIENMPYIVLTDFGKRYDTLWHTLAHELAHVLFHFDDIKAHGAHFTGDLDLFQDAALEEEANLFADKLLLSPEYDAFIPQIIRMRSLVRQYAAEWNVHESILYGRYLRDNEEHYKFYRNDLISSEVALKNIKVTPWEKRALKETLQELKVLTA